MKAGAVAIVALALLALGRKRSSTVALWTRKSSSVLLSSSTEDLITEILEAAGVSGAVVTSGRRTWAQQAALMIGETDKALYDLYNDGIIDKLLAIERTEDAWAAEIERLAGLGYYVSRHTRDPERAFDLRTSNLTSTQKTAITRAAEGLGVEVIDEGDHLHFEW